MWVWRPLAGLDQTTGSGELLKGGWRRWRVTGGPVGTGIRIGEVRLRLVEPDAPEPTPDTVAESTPDVASPDRGNTPESDLDEAIKGRTTGCDGGGAGHSPGPLVVLMLLLVLGVGRTRRRPSKAS